ncbi:hypothetical protein [Nocardiopsis quinghaiensis]|uniref:hypothetical protein n=1 Tax=Nocardiopsis quinghaiensis TaxID=464995 RepID=UPI001238C229|nr:hypothetical protein [Nocardiopsis quinghaiensis]
MEHHPSGRHRRPRQSLAGRVWALTAALLAIALAAVFVPQHPRRPHPEKAAITPPPRRRRELPPAPAKRRPLQDPPGFPTDDVWRTSASRTSSRWGGDYHDDGHVTEKRGTDPHEVEDALVRPYMVPFPRVPVGDLLAGAVESTAPAGPTATAAPSGGVADDMGDLAAVIRLYLDRVG